MDRSAVRKVVEDNIEGLVQKLGIPHWRIVIDYDLRDDEALGQCTWRVDYNSASISLDVDSFKDGEHVLKVLRHELFHVLLSPYSVVRNAIGPLLDQDPIKKAMIESVWTHSMEKAIINLERMYNGLTDKPPEAPPGLPTEPPIDTDGPPAIS
jgi:hypothetical protein